MSPQQVERRAHPRAPIATKVAVEMEGHSFLAIGENMGAGGLLICTGHPAAVGTKLQLTFTLPGRERPFRVSAVVRYVFADNSMGVEFEGITPEERAAIRDYSAKTSSDTSA